MKKIAILCFCVTAFVFAQFPEKVVTFKYSKTRDGDSEETALVYYEPYKASYMFVTDPLTQYVRMFADQLLYYYPDRNIAIKMNNPDALIATIPVQLFVNSGAEDLGLTDLGFELTDYYAQGDTLVRTWELSGKKKDEYLRIDVFSHKEHVFRTLSLDADKKMIKSVTYSDWMNISNDAYPLEIVILEDGHIEEFRFEGVKHLNGLPDSIHSYFNLPKDCDIHEYIF
jgi:hypothetical protein